MEFWINIQAGDGTKYGPGPITTATKWETTARLDRAGRFSFEMPAGDPQAALCQAKREAWCYALVNGVVTLIGAGIIDEMETKVDLAGQPMLSVGGDDLLRELTYRSVGFLEVVTPAGQASPDALSEVMAEAPGAWSLDTVTGYGATENDVYASFAGETVLAALGKVGEHTGEHFRLGSGKKVVWLQDDLTVSGVRAIGQADPSAVGDNDDVCLITELSESQGSYDLCTRLFAFGAGNGQARVSLADTSVSAHAGYVIDKSNPKGANLTHSAAFATYGQIERFLSWKEISPISNTDADIESAANALYTAAYQYLSRYCQVQYSYKLNVTKLEKPVLPGQKIRVIWREVVDDYVAVDIDADLTVLETTTKLDASGLRTVAMQVSTIDAWPQTFAEIIAGQLEEARLMDGHPQTFAGYYSEGLGNFNVSPTYSAMARFKFDDRITRLVSAKLRFTTAPFEATATAAASGGGSSQSSSSGGGSSQSSSSQGSHSHSFGITVRGGPASASYDVYWDANNHRFHLPSVGSGEDDQQSQTSASGGSHSHNVSVPNHSHNVTIPSHTHPLQYGITRSGTYPGGVTIWVNGVNRTFELTGQTSLGTATGSTGMVEVELANILNLDFRREHTIELKCASGYGQILNVALRCFVIVQAILALAEAPVSHPTPGEPTVAVAATADGWRVTWLAVSGAESYRLYGNTVGSDSGAEEITLTTSREVLVPYTVGGFSWFAGTAIAGTNESEIGPWATDASAPANPTWVSHAFGLGGHLVQWYHPDLARVENFVLYRNTAAEEAGATEVETVSGVVTSYLFPYAAGAPYFGVKAVSWAGISSAIVWTGQAYDPTPLTPNPSANMIEAGGFVISWDTMPNTATYEVQSATDDQGTGAILRWSGQALFTPPIAFTNHKWFRVRSIGYDGSSFDWSGWASDNNPPPQPNVVTTADIRSVSVSLAAADTSHLATGFSHYVFERADGPNGESATTLDPQATYASFPRVFSQTTGVTKYFRLTPYDWAGNAGTSSAWVAATPSESGATVKDKFDTYGGLISTPVESLYWLSFTDFDTDEAWWYGQGGDPAISDTVNLLEGNRGLKLTDTPVGAWTVSRDVVYNLGNDSRMGPNDWLVGSMYVHSTFPGQTYDLNIQFHSGTGNYFYASQPIDNVVGWQHFQITVQSLLTVGTPSWDNITRIDVTLWRTSGSGTRPNVTVDRLRLSKRKPSTPGYWDDTGESWLHAYTPSTNIAVPLWHILPGNRPSEPAKPFSYAQLVNAAAPSYDRGYLAYKPGLEIQAGTIQTGIFHKFNGKSGLAFFIKNTTPDHWTMYEVAVDNVADSIKLFKWVDGTRTELGSAAFTGFISAGGVGTGQTVWVGADFSDYNSNSGRIKVFASFVEGNLIQANNLKISVQDTEVGSGGTVGLVSHETGCRFMNFVAGSPAHAEVADVALALDGPWLAGDVRRVHYNRDSNSLEYTDDGQTFIPVVGGGSGMVLTSSADTIPDYLGAKLLAGDDITITESEMGPGYKQLGIAAGANLLRRTSANRPGVTKLYRRDNDSGYSVQTHWTGSHWWLRGYDGSDNFHGECLVQYANSLAVPTRGCVVYRGVSNITGTPGVWTAITFNIQAISQQNNGPLYDGATAIYTVKTGWHLISISMSFIAHSTGTLYQLCIGLNGSPNTVYGLASITAQGGQTYCLTVSRPYWIAAGVPIQAYFYKFGSGNFTLLSDGGCALAVAEMN